MSFVMIAAGTTSRARVRTLSARTLAGLAMLAGATLLAAGGTFGYWLAAAPIASPRPAAAVLGAAGHQEATPFTLEQLGALSGRLFRLESEAAQLSRRVGITREQEPATSGSTSPVRAGPAPAEPSGASGGPWLAPRATSSAFDAIDVQLAHLEQQIAAVAGAAAQRSVEQMRLPTRPPVLGAEQTSGFGNRLDPFVHSHAFHAGLDFAAVTGTPILSSAGGVVAFAGFKRDFGWVVEIDHGNGLATRYAHASALLVKSGEVVIPGERIAVVGSSGRSTGPHLHFEVLRAGEAVDPKRYLAAR